MSTKSRDKSIGDVITKISREEYFTNLVRKREEKFGYYFSERRTPREEHGIESIWDVISPWGTIQPIEMVKLKEVLRLQEKYSIGPFARKSYRGKPITVEGVLSERLEKRRKRYPVSYKGGTALIPYQVVMVLLHMLSHRLHLSEKEIVESGTLAFLSEQYEARMNRKFPEHLEPSSPRHITGCLERWRRGGGERWARRPLEWAVLSFYLCWLWSPSEEVENRVVAWLGGKLRGVVSEGGEREWVGECLRGWEMVLGEVWGEIGQGRQWLGIRGGGKRRGIRVPREFLLLEGGSKGLSANRLMVGLFLCLKMERWGPFVNTINLRPANIARALDYSPVLIAKTLRWFFKHNYLIRLSSPVEDRKARGCKAAWKWSNALVRQKQYIQPQELKMWLERMKANEIKGIGEEGMFRYKLGKLFGSEEEWAKIVAEENLRRENLKREKMGDE